MKSYLDDVFEMPDKEVALLIRFLDQNNCKLSKRAIEKEFSESEKVTISLNYSIKGKKKENFI